MTVQTEIGKLIEGDQERDAIHIAVAPVTAAQKLAPGQGIAFADDSSENVIAAQAAIGIVDPFLPGLVFPGQRFWMFLFPNTITSLKHNWTHPAFEKQTAPVDLKAASEAWLRNFIANADCPDYKTLIAAVQGAPINPDDNDYYSSLFEGEYFHFNGLDAHGEIPAEFWDHIEVVTGRKVSARPAHFSCSC